MSRCFPYPPPGFINIGNKASDEALIDSIKLQKVEKANKEQRKEKRKEKKEKRKEKKEKSKEKKEKKRLLKKENKEIVNTKLTDIDQEAHKDVKNLAEFDGENSHKRKHEVIEQLEGSSVTEEHGQPLNLQNPSYSSDSTQNCNKRRKQVSIANDICGFGNIIKIKLPLQKHNESGSTVSKKQMSSTSGFNVSNKEADVSTSEEQCCSTSGRSEKHKQNCSGSGCTFLDYSGQDVRTSQVDADRNSLRTNNSLHDLSSGPSNEMGSLTAPNDEVLAKAHRQITCGFVPSSCSTSFDKKMLKRNSQYTNLIQNLCHMALPQLVDNDEEWLFGGKPSDNLFNKSNVEKQFAVSSGVTCSGSSMQYPCARYLQEAEMLALPYTVPF